MWLFYWLHISCTTPYPFHDQFQNPRGLWHPQLPGLMPILSCHLVCKCCNTNDSMHVHTFDLFATLHIKTHSITFSSSLPTSKWTDFFNIGSHLQERSSMKTMMTYWPVNFQLSAYSRQSIVLLMHNTIKMAAKTMSAKFTNNCSVSHFL